MPFTADGSAGVINGTFDQIYEEKFFCRDGWGWSPEGKQVAYRPLDARGVKAFRLTDDTAANSRPNCRNSAGKLGVWAARSGPGSSILGRAGY